MDLAREFQILILSEDIHVETQLSSWGVELIRELISHF